MEAEDRTDRYAGAAEAYRRSRPAYPDHAIRLLTSALGLGPAGHIVDLGSGTGMLARHLASYGYHVSAVEPSDAMRAKIPESERVVRVAGSAESTGLPSGCADAVFAATAWHWFDADRAIREVRRLLAPGRGGLGLLWNLYDESVPWVAAYADITARRRPASTPSARSGAWRTFFEKLDGWEPLREERVANPRSTTPAALIDRLLSSSVIAALTPNQQDALRAEGWDTLRAHGLADNPRVTLPYVTLVCWTRPSDDT